MSQLSRIRNRIKSQRKMTDAEGSALAAELSEVTRRHEARVCHVIYDGGAMAFVGDGELCERIMELIQGKHGQVTAVPLDSPHLPAERELE